MIASKTMTMIKLRAILLEFGESNLVMLGAQPIACGCGGCGGAIVGNGVHPPPGGIEKDGIMIERWRLVCVYIRVYSVLHYKHE